MTSDLTRALLLLGTLFGGKEAPARRRQAGPVLGLTEAGEEVVWPLPSRERAGHVLVLGASGSGKTSLVAHALLEESLHFGKRAAGERPALLLVDPKGDLAALLLSGLAARAPERLADVRFLDPFGQAGFAFNLCRLPLGEVPADIRSLQLAHLVASVSTGSGTAHIGMGARQIDVLQHALLAALTCEKAGASVLLALDALGLPGGLAQLAEVSSSERARAFCESAKVGEELRASCSSRLRSAFAATESLERLLAASGCISFEDLLAPGRITIIDLGRPVGGMTTLQTFYANLLCRLAIEHLLARPSPWGGHHCRVVVDEAQVVAPVLGDIAEVLLTTGRSRGISLSLISQGTTLIQQASPNLLRVAMTNTPVKIVGRLSAPDAELLARERAPSAGSEEAMGAYRGRLVSSLTNLPDRGFYELVPGGAHRFRSHEVDLAAWREAERTRAGEISAAKARLALPRGEVRRLRLSDMERAPRTRTDARPRPRVDAAQAPDPVPVSRWG